MSVLTPEQHSVVLALVRDVAATIRLRDEAEFESYLIARGQDALDQGFVATLDEFRQKLVGDFQQRVHDEFIDSTWPTCPRHPTPPLWLDQGSWWCTRDQVVVAALGELRSMKADRG